MTDPTPEPTHLETLAAGEGLLAASILDNIRTQTGGWFDCDCGRCIHEGGDCHAWDAFEEHARDAIHYAVAHLAERDFEALRFAARRARQTEEDDSALRRTVRAIRSRAARGRIVGHPALRQDEPTARHATRSACAHSPHTGETMTVRPEPPPLLTIGGEIDLTKAVCQQMGVPSRAPYLISAAGVIAYLCNPLVKLHEAQAALVTQLRADVARLTEENAGHLRYIAELQAERDSSTDD